MIIFTLCVALIAASALRLVGALKASTRRKEMGKEKDVFSMCLIIKKENKQKKDSEK